MRKLLAVLLVVAVVLGGGYYTYWHKKADEFKQMFVDSANSLNASAKPYTKDLEVLRYTSVSVTGFPFTMVLEISQPVIDLPVSAMIQEAQRRKGITTPLPYEWVEEISYGDKVTLTGNITGDHYTATANGDRTHKSLINRAVRHTLVGTSSSPLVCNLGVEQVKGGAPWTMQPIFTDAKTFLAIFRSCDCDVKGIALKDAASGNPLFSMEGFSDSVSNEATGTGANHKVTFKLDLKKGKATPAFDAIANDYMLMLYTLRGKADEVVSPFPFSEYGEHNALIDIVYDGPTEASAWSDPGMNLHFDINHLDLQSAISTMTLEMHAASTPQGNDRTVSLAFHEKADITERGDQLSKKRFTDILAAVAKNPGKTHPGDPGMQFFQTLSTLGSPADVVGKLYPDMHSLGKMAFDIDFNVKGPNENAKFLRHASATLDDFNLLATPYGIKTKGSANAGVAGKMPSGELSITCISCDALVSDLGSYAMRVESVVDQLSKPPKPAFLNKDLIESAKQFLHGISESGTASDLVIHFVMGDTGPPTISGKQLPEILALYMATIAPHLPQPSAAVGGQPELTSPPGVPGR